jgi:hypothetical protein
MKCSRCNSSENGFYRLARSPSGYNGVCKECCKEKSRESYVKNVQRWDSIYRGREKRIFNRVSDEDFEDRMHLVGG